MFQVRCGIKLSHWPEGQVFSNPNGFKTMTEAKFEVNNMLNTIIKKLFKKVKHDKLLEIPKDYKAWYVGKPEELLLARMDGTVEDGEFYIAVFEV
jgi:hypothetical protein